ncbi:MAG: 2'-5' RNA ligase [Sphingomonas sp. 28-66-16]|nr:MAG: 2'-5' RNA ligase [Sphingomonas sp. 28-66-16]
MYRLFVGLRPPPPIRARLRATMHGVGGARWQSDDQLHLTLRYIGAVDRRRAEDIALALGQIHGVVPDVRLDGVGRFERQGRTDTLWAGVAPQAGLGGLHRKIDHALVRLGLAPEGRAFIPHITLARLPRSLGTAPEIDTFLAREASLASEPFAMPHLILFESHLTSDGARYDTIERWPLG